MIYGSVCSGIEAATVAWHPLGWRPAWFSEIDTFPSKVLAHHYPGVTNHGDFTRIGTDAGPIDILVGGTPCQAFSIAGLRGGLGDERGNLALEYCRLADRLRPRWVVWENVPGVLSSNGGRDFGSILGALAQLGYGWAYRVLDAQFFGVPQRRRRVFVVGYLGDWRRAAAVLFEPESLRWNPPARGEKRKAAARGAGRRVAVGVEVAGTLGGGSGSRGWACNTDRMTFVPSPVPILEVNKRQGSKGSQRDGLGIGQPGDPMFTLQAGAQHGVAVSITGHIAHTLRADGFDASEDGTGRGDQRSAAPQVFGRNNTSGPITTSHALSAHGGPPGRLDFETESFVVTRGVRRLTPRECERLQGFPDDYTAIPGAADGPRYKALGNSMAVPVMRWIGERIQRVEEITNRYR